MIEEYSYEDEEEVEYYAIRPNKTQIKKDIAALFALGEEMSALSVVQLELLGLPEEILQAVSQVAVMSHTGARKRLLKYIAGQLHKIEPDSIQTIMENMARIKNKSAHAVREHHIAERWRDRLIAEGDNALTDLLDEHPHANHQQLRQLLRNIQKETQTVKPPRSSRLLYRYLKGLFKLEAESESDQELNSDH